MGRLRGGRGLVAIRPNGSVAGWPWAKGGEESGPATRCRERESATGDRDLLSKGDVI